jgi:hypothetical protein
MTDVPAFGAVTRQDRAGASRSFHDFFQRQRRGHVEADKMVEL